MVVPWTAQTQEAWDPLSTILTIRIRIGGVTVNVPGVFDTGADMSELQPPMLNNFGIDPNQHGFTPGQDLDGNPRLIPVVFGEATFDGHVFDLPVALYPFQTRPVHVVGRAGLLDYFKVTLDSAAAETHIDWVGLTAHSRLDEIRHNFIDQRIGTRQQYLDAGCT